jgi:hypothetical protein
MEVLVVALAVVLLFVRMGRRKGANNTGDVGPVGWVAGTDWRVVRPLGRADLRRVLRHPAFLVGVALTPLMLLPATEYATTWREASGGIALALVPLGWLTIVATNLVALRPQRTGTGELFATLPTPQPVRTTALLTTALGPVIAATLLAVAWIAYLSGNDLRGNVLLGAPDWKEIGVGVLIVAGSVCVGVSVARWLRHPGFGVLAAIVTMLIQARFLDVTTWPWHRPDGDPMRFLAFIAEGTNADAEFLEVRPAGWHLLYVGALVVVMAAVALARDGLRRPVAAILGCALLLAAGAGWVQTRPPSTAREAEMVSYLTDPRAHQVCEESDGVRYCAYRQYAEDLAEWREVVEATLAVLPRGITDNRPPLAVTQRPPSIKENGDCGRMQFEDALPPTVAARMSAEALWPADGQVHPPFREETFPCSDRDVRGFFLAVQTSAWAVGLPSAPHHDDVRCDASGQARAAIALWAGAAASPDGASTLRDVTVEGSRGKPQIGFTDWGGPPVWGVEYGVADARLASSMLELEPAAVRDAIARDWSRWTDRSTPSWALAHELGVTTVDATFRASSPSCA